MSEVVVATNNAHKLREVSRMFAAEFPGLGVASLADVEPYPEPAETEDTFEGNATIKARECTARTGKPALADDSGLEVDVLGGMPGVRSARWAGPQHDDDENLALLLRQIDDVPPDRRGARFVCAMALTLPDGAVFTVRGVVEGRLITSPRGTNGFGYDPIFVPDGYTVTTAELSPSDKDAISHRGKAVRAILEVLATLT